MNTKKADSPMICNHVTGEYLCVDCQRMDDSISMAKERSELLTKIESLEKLQKIGAKVNYLAPTTVHEYIEANREYENKL